MKDTFSISGNGKPLLWFNKHWVSIVKPVLVFSLAIAASLFILYLSFHIVFGGIIFRYLLFIISVLCMTVSIHWVFFLFIRWDLSRCIITTERIIIFQNTPFIKEDVDIISIEEVHRIEQKTYGLIRNLLNYGDVLIFLAASPTAITLSQIPSPSKFVEIVGKIREKNHEFFHATTV
jgi:hypothetical protein